MIRNNVPLYQQIVIHAKKIKGRDVQAKSPAATTILSSPKRLARFAPVSSMIGSDVRASKAKIAAKLKANSAGLWSIPAAGRGERPAKASAFLARFAGANIEDRKASMAKPEKKDPEDISPKMQDEDEFVDTEAIRIPNATVVSSPGLIKKRLSDFSVMKPPSLFIKKADSTVGPTATYCECGNLCTSGKSQCEACDRSKDLVELSGFLLQKRKKTGALVKRWFNLLNKELYSKSVAGYSGGSIRQAEGDAIQKDEVADRDLHQGGARGASGHDFLLPVQHLLPAGQADPLRINQERTDGVDQGA